MKNISTEFKRALFYNHRDYIAFANITLVDGTVLNLTNDEIWQGGYSREDAISEDENFTVLGSAIINSATLIINNINSKFSQYTFENATVKLTEAMQFNENGSTRIERLKAGTYTVDSTNYNGATIRLSLIDNMSKFDRPYSESSLVYPASCVTIIRDACSVCGVQLNNFESALKNLSIANPPEKDGTTFREVISWVATICGCYARCNIEGDLDLQWIDTELLQSTFDGIDGGEFDTNSPYYATGDTADGELFNPWTNDNEYDGGAFSDLNNIAVIKNLSSQNICVDDTVIAGVRILVKDKSANSESDILSYIYPANYTDGFVVEISDNEFITTNNVQPILNHIGQLLYGMTFRKLNVTQLSDPSIEAGDIGLVIDRKQNTYAIIVTRCTFKIGSRQTIVCGSESALNNSSSRFSQATKTYLETKSLINVERNARVIALENLADALESKSGLYTTVETTESGDIFYLHDLPNLSESSVVWKMTDEGWGVTTNYNGDHPEQTVWNAGMTVDGDAIVRILSAEGINADWIDSGTIRITDGNGNVTFEADTATGAVRINATSFSLTGQSINNIVQNTVNGMDLSNVVMELDNTYQLISTDANGNYDTFPTCTTTAKVFYGTTNVTANCTFSTPVVQNLTGTWNASTKTYTVTGMTADSGTVTITALYGSYQVSKKLTVAKIKQGRDGADGTSVNILGSYNTVAELQAAHPTGSVGDAYIVSGDLYVWADNAWTNVGQIQGPAGQNGANGTNGTSAYVHFAYSTSSDGHDNFSVTPFNGAVYIGVRSDSVVQDSTVYTDYTWSKMKGDDGRGVTSITEYYGVSNSANTQPASWSTSVVNPTSSNRYLWNYNTTAYTSGNPTSTTPRVIGMYSENGTNGRGISSITEYYQVSSSSTTAPTSWSTSMVNTTTTNKYLWNYEKITYTDGSESSSTPRIIGTHGATGTSARTYLLEVSPKSTKMTQANVYSPNQITIKSYYRDGTSTSKTAYSATYKVDVCVGNTWYENICSIGSRTVAVLELRYDAQASTPYDYYDSGAAPDPTDTFDVCAVLSPGSTSVRVRMLNESTLLDQEEIALLSDATAVVLDQESVFNALTNNGQDQGIFLNASDHKIYINSSYIATGTLKVGGYNNENGTIRILDANNNLIGGLNNTEIYQKNALNNDKVSISSGEIAFYKNTSSLIGTIALYDVGTSDRALDIYSSNGWLYLRASRGIVVEHGSSYNMDVSKLNVGTISVGNGYSGTIKLPTSINSSTGAVTSWADVRVQNGVILYS